MSKFHPRILMNWSMLLFAVVPAQAETNYELRDQSVVLDLQIGPGDTATVRLPVSVGRGIEETPGGLRVERKDSQLRIKMPVLFREKAEALFFCTERGERYRLIVSEAELGVETTAHVAMNALTASDPSCSKSGMTSEKLFSLNEASNSYSTVFRRREP